MAASKKTSTVKSSVETIQDNVQTQNIIIGCVIALILIALFGTGIAFFLFQQRNYTLSNKLTSPRLENLPEFSNSEKLNLRGSAKEESTVALFVDGEDSGKRVETRGNGRYEFEDVRVDTEKKYKFKTAVVEESFNKKERSKFSNEQVVTIDRTAPSKNIRLGSIPKEVSGRDISVQGKTAEKNAKVVLKFKDGDKLSINTDANGNFRLDGVKLEPGKNTIEVWVKDQAGNEVNTGKKIEVTFKTTGSTNGSGSESPDPGDINGPGATDEDLPESAGEVEAVVAFVQSNVMFMILMLALIGGVVFMNVGEGLKSVKE